VSVRSHRRLRGPRGWVKAAPIFRAAVRRIEALHSRESAPYVIRGSRSGAARVSGIARRAACTIAPAAWQPWALGRGVLNIVLDHYLAGDAELHRLLNDLEQRIGAGRPTRAVPGVPSGRSGRACE
jgi:hypothetical protein